MIGCAWAGAAAGINLAGVLLLAYLWWSGSRQLMQLERDWKLAEAAREAKQRDTGNGL